MKTVTNVIYELEDYEKVWDMGIEEIIEYLQNIDHNWIGDSNYIYNSDNTYYEGDTDDYLKYRYHAALVKAEEIIREYQLHQGPVL